MSWIVIVLIVIAVLLVIALVVTATQRKRDQLGRQRADELRSKAAATAAEHPEQEARAREAEAQAEQARARADQLAARADEHRTAYDQSQAQQEDHLREANRVDPDVDHESLGNTPEADVAGPDHGPGGRPTSPE
jgi:FtsZ-interacting cell division protein ZipA